MNKAQAECEIKRRKELSDSIHKLGNEIAKALYLPQICKCLEAKLKRILKK